VVVVMLGATGSSPLDRPRPTITNLGQITGELCKLASSSRARRADFDRLFHRHGITPSDFDKELELRLDRTAIWQLDIPSAVEATS